MTMVKRSVRQRANEHILTPFFHSFFTFCSPFCASNKSAPSPHIDQAVRKQWIENILAHQEYDASSIKIRLCELHFDPENIKKGIINGKHWRELKKGSVPTVFPERCVCTFRIDPTDCVSN